ncbi:MAG: SH3 domain-containing protein [Thiotrichaceae bacterium]|nr:SH3 domain-containing protein [Thiotrichaceae bacterium]
MKPRFLGSLAVYSLGLLVNVPSFAENALDESQIKQLFSTEMRGYQPQNVRFQLGEFGAGHAGAIVALENAQNQATGKELWLLEYDKQWKIRRKLADKVAEFQTVDFEKNAKPALFFTRSNSPAKGVQQTEFKVISLQQDRELFSQTALDNTGAVGLMNSQFQEHRVEFDDVDKDGSLELIDTEIKIAYLGNQQSDSLEKKTIYKMQQGRLQVFDPNAPAKPIEKIVTVPEKPSSNTASISLAPEKKPLSSKPVTGNNRITIGAGVRVRMQPKATAKEVTRLQFGTVIREIEKAKQSEFLGDKRDYWYKVAVPDGKQGWVFGSFITPIDVQHLPEKYIELAKTQLANDALQFSDWVDVVNFLNRVSSEVADAGLATELASLRQQGLARSLKAIPAGQAQQSPYKEWLTEQANFVIYHAPSGTWRVK